MLIKQSSAVVHIPFFMTDSSDHVSGKTGLTPTVTISKNCGAFASPSGAITEISDGWYKLAANATDSNTLGFLALHATGTGADATDMIVGEVVSFDPQDAVRAGLTALPNAAAAASGGLFTRGTGAGQINQDANGRIDVNVMSTVSVAEVARWTGTCRSGADNTSSSVALPAGTTLAQVHPGGTIELTGGTAANQMMPVFSVSGMGGSTPRADGPTGFTFQGGATSDSSTTLKFHPGPGVVLAAIQLGDTGAPVVDTDNIFNTALTESYAALGGSPTLTQFLYAIQQFFSNAETSGNTMTVYRVDGVTPAFTLTLNSAYPAELPTTIARET